MKRLLFAALLISPLVLRAQAPGGVSTNLRLWLKANSGVSLNASSTVAQWTELSGAGITGNFSTQGANIGMGTGQNPPAYQASGINFNPQLVFSQAVVNSISSNNAFAGTQLIDPYNNTVLQVIKLHTMGNTGVWFKWQYNNTNANRFGNEVNNGGANTGKLRFDFRGINNYSNTVIADRYFMAACNTTQAQSIIRLNGADDAVVNFTTQGSFSPPATSPARITLGNEEYGDAYPTTIDIAEVIMYNRALTAAERNKVESYLAVKYGFTLDQSALSANNYTSPRGTIIWNRAANLPFTSNITGIGRDDADSLDQRQSRSINAAGLVTIYNGSHNGMSFPPLNTDNGTGFSADHSYLLFGDNGGSLLLNRCFSGNPAFLRMNRSWKTQVTGTIGTVTLSARTASMTAQTTHLLVSTDSAFTPAATTVYKLDTSNGFLSKSLVLQDGSFFTFASDSLILRPTSNSPLCVGNTIQLKASVPGVGTFSWTGPNGFTSTLQNPAIPAAGVANSGVYTVNATTNGCPFKAGNVSVIVSTMPAPPTIITPLIYCQDDAALPLTANGQNLTWYALPQGGGSGTTTPPVPTTLREGTFTWWVTQGNNGCESIRSKQVVHVRNRPNGIITTSRAVICQGDEDSFFYFGNAHPTAMQYDWKSPIGRTAFLSGSGQGPVVIRFDSAGVINVRLQINNGGCVSREMLLPITVNPRPIAHGVVPADACLNDIVNIALNDISPQITNYIWDFNNGREHYAAYPGGPYGISWSTPGRKTVSITTSSKGCRSFTTVDTITIHDVPDADIFRVSADNICSGDSVLAEIRADDTANVYAWSPQQYFPGLPRASAWSIVQRTGHIGVTVVSRWGCVAKDSILVTTRPCCEVALPTGFTPNGDGRNDRFRIITAGHHQIADFRVVNRWGQTVFETQDETRGWDGSYNGQPQEVGTYFYYLRFKCREGAGRDVEQKGEVVLIR